ncbi:transposase [Microtetraspora glauca]|uniref:Transposase n=1 Tax=Microtetraspora glauca TaxID=1996 RepID=A0ABV3GER6_MICGL
MRFRRAAHSVENAAGAEERADELSDAETSGADRETGARVLAELGDDRTRFADARALKAYAGSAPIIRASGGSRSRMDFSAAQSRSRRDTACRGSKSGWIRRRSAV